MYVTSSFLLLCLVVGFGSASKIKDDMRKYSITVRRMESPLKTLARMNVHPSKVEELFKRSTNGGNTSIPLTKFIDWEFYGEVEIGKPKQKFNVLLDTSWSNTFIPSITCSMIRHPSCAIHDRYDRTRSNTSIAGGKMVLPFGDTNMTGLRVTDLFHLGQVNITNQTFTAIDNLPWNFLLTRADGILGLGFESIAVANITPVFYNMIKQGAIQKEVFSLYMNRDPSSPRAGTLFFGGVEERHYRGNFTFAKITKIGYWQFRMDGIKVKTQSFCRGGCETIVDTSIMSIIGPEDEIAAINLNIKAKKFAFGRYLIDCNSLGHLPPVTFVINGRPFILKTKDYVQKISWGGVMLCMSAFVESEGTLWELGGAFLSRFYVQFDLGNTRIGFTDVLMETNAV